MSNVPIDSSQYFYSELYKSLDEDTSKDNVQLCLITNQPLSENWVELNCKHKFNYVPLYNDILIHKKTFNRLEKRLLKVNEIRCPYCRNIQDTVLPYCEMVGVKKINGVNYIDESIMSKFNVCGNGYATGTCAFVTHAVTGDDGETTEVFTCKNKLVKLLELDGKTYCTTHKYQVMKEHEKQQKLKAKEQAKQEKQEAQKKAKEQAKQEKEKAKQDAKQKAKEEKEKAKQEKASVKTTKNPLSQDENVVLPPAAATNGCNYIFKIGAKKGTSCGCKVFQSNATCKKHLVKEVVEKVQVSSNE